MMLDANSVKFEDQFFTQSHKQMQVIAKPLKRLGIEHFSMQVSHGGGVFEILTTHPNFSQLFIDEKFYEKYLAGSPSDYSSCVCTYDNLGCEEVYNALINSEGINNGIAIVNALSDRTEIFYFGSNCKDNIYFINNLPLLHQFISYFKLESVDLLAQSSLRKFTYPNSRDCSVITSDSWRIQSHLLSDCSDLFRDLVPPQGRWGIGFTPRELEAIELLCLGYPAKKIAMCMHVSLSAVQGFISTIKDKVGCKTIGQILRSQDTDFVSKLTKSSQHHT